MALQVNSNLGRNTFCVQIIFAQSYKCKVYGHQRKKPKMESQSPDVISRLAALPMVSVTKCNLSFRVCFISISEILKNVSGFYSIFHIHTLDKTKRKGLTQMEQKETLASVFKYNIIVSTEGAMMDLVKYTMCFLDHIDL